MEFEKSPGRRACALLAALLMLTACGVSGEGTSSLPEEVPAAGEVPEAVEPSETVELYHLYFGEKSYALDKTGRLLSEDEVYIPLRDLNTGENRYRLYTRVEDTGEDDEWGNPVTQKYSRLCDLEGNVIVVWEPMEYTEGMGKLVIRREPRNFYETIFPGEEYQTALWDPATGEAVVEGVDTLQALENGHFLAMDASGLVLGVLDAQGNVISGFPAPADYYYPSTCNGWIVGNQWSPYSDNETEYPDQLMDENFEVLLEGEGINVSFIGLRGPYVLRNGEGDVREVISLEDFSTLWSYDQEKDGRLNYYDGELVILQVGEPGGQWERFFRTVEGETLAGGAFDQLEPSDQSLYGKDPAETFVGRRGDTVFLLDREGNTLAQTELPGLESISVQEEGYIACTLSNPAQSGDIYSYDSPMALLTPELESLIPAGEYASISILTSEEGIPMLQCGRMINGSYRFDLMDLSGRMVVDRATDIGTVGDGKVAVVRGFSMGLMDLEGNWISRYSVYTGLNDD